ncbi:MAG TPA: DNA helicase RecQ [Spirochaetota bacterium]|nr:DNA helicase RecQ [Spirochaetota bacterium]HPS86932.1 DNA helicase RecQ [Spirochaetota bacterium]
MKREKEILKNIFGYDEFRSLQMEIITSILNKKDALVVMPTGGGKSLCYQLPALLFDGLTVVVSPLISLMKDQVDQMKQLGVDAVLLNSSITRQEYNENISHIREGKVKLLYVAPETLLKNDVLQFLESINVECFAIDEAHCISEWGHDFRPEYRKIANVRKRFPGAVCIALTATATARVRSDIRKNLELSETNDFVASFNRGNLFYKIIPKDNPLEQTLEFLEQYKNESGIIYCFSRDSVDRLYLNLKKQGYKVRPYHAGLSDDERQENQELFLKDEVQIMVATIAFGMGIHKTNVRYVIHFDLPKSIEAYYQETGRAGRDGVNSTCLLLYSYSDIHKIKYFLDQKSDGEEKKAALTQLNALTDYADTSGCRRIPLITYFGEEYTEPYCGMCDNCVSPEVHSDDITVQAQMFLSCVKRTGERFGAGHIIDILRGSKSKKVNDFNHQALSTYGIGKGYSKDTWMKLVRQFMRQKLILSDAETSGVLKLTGKAYNVMKGAETVMGSLHDDKKRNISGSAAKEYNSGLFEILREKRRELSVVENVPPYVIFSDKTLFEIASFFPQSHESLLKIHGIGAHKIEKYGDIILAIVTDYCSAEGIEEGSESPNMKVYIKKPRHIEISELYNSGIPVSEITEKEGIQQRTVIDHLFRYIQDGGSIRRDLLLPLIPSDEKYLALIIDAFERAGAEKLRPVFEVLNGAVDYDTINICRIYYLSKD